MEEKEFDTIQLSNLVETLSSILKEHGDMGVYYHEGGWDDADTIEKVVLNETKEKGKYVLLVY